MSWKYHEPQRCDFDSDEDYEDALAAYNSCLDDYCDMCREDRY